eukprot:Partr_v1_DN26341_c0_g1_i1_m43098 putative ariadne homolog, ubiquitin-conjugating enzyme E2 binding protein, 1 (Drosophila)
MDDQDDFYDDHEEADGEEEEDFYHDEDDDHIMDFQPISNTSLHRPDFDYSPLSMSDLVARQTEEVTHISELFNIPHALAFNLLRHFRWNKDRLLERYMENSTTVLDKAGVSAQKFQLKPQLAPDSFSCSICCSDSQDSPGLEVQALDCGHEFCTNCYRYYLVQKITDEGESRHLHCPAAKCARTVVEKVVERILSEADDQKTLSLYRQLLLKTYVEDVENLKWCPSAGCETIVRCDVRPSQLKRVVPSVRCSNGHEFCFGCSLESHEPCICALVAMWLKKCADDSETGNWIAANTKECSKCKYTIEKNGGCNHMTCKNCRYEFCWVCMGPWSEHGQSYYNCNRFDEKSSKEARQEHTSSRAALERYLHYFNRYDNHMQSSKLASKFYGLTEKKMEEMQLQSDFSWIEVQFIRKALDTVIECRSTLKWTYAYAFYLKKSNVSVLYEDNQRDLEMAVETLNELIEQPLPPIDDPEQKQRLADLKQSCLDKTEYCARRRRVVLEDTARGLQEERWTYNVEI